MMDQRLALLIAAPRPGESAMHADLLAVYDALRRRGFRPEECLALDGAVRREPLLAALHDVRDRMAGWSAGELFLYYSGHGAFWPWEAAVAAAARPALLLADGSEEAPNRWVFWDEMFAALHMPPGVQLTLLPDC